MALLLLSGGAVALRLEEALRANVAEHAEERAHSRRLGFSPIVFSSPPPPSTVHIEPRLVGHSPSPPLAARARSCLPPFGTHVHKVPRHTLGMGSQCPFDTDELIHATKHPVLTEAECEAIRQEAEERMAEGARSSFTMTETNRDVPVHEMPRTLRWLEEGGLLRLCSLARACFASAVSERGLWVYRGLVIKYSFDEGLTHQPIHRDASLLSCLVPLSRSSEYEGGGTWIEPLGQSLVLEQGHALLHPSAVRHAGGRLRGGTRVVLVLFLNSHRMHFGEHGRRLRARAQNIFAAAQEAAEEREAGAPSAGGGEEDAAPAGEDDEDDEELACLRFALEVTEESDHELFYDLGARAHDLGQTQEALRMYRRAEELNDKDPMLLSNMGVAMLELGEPRAAIRYYRRALAADPYNVNAYYNCGELLLELNRLRGLDALLKAAPDEVMAEPEMQELAAELESISNVMDNAVT
ncbi:hypothetical protein AB1Y20_007183 [Prymnesium parvum]|uniref:Fe2OG dioxygenase domain-containing protein n=1 Tax=Prymnesium parvum TaxID=97485 RepID=A0AB34IWY0_PRYPA